MRSNQMRKSRFHSAGGEYLGDESADAGVIGWIHVEKVALQHAGQAQPRPGAVGVLLVQRQPRIVERGSRVVVPRDKPYRCTGGEPDAVNGSSSAQSRVGWGTGSAMILRSNGAGSALLTTSISAASICTSPLQLLLFAPWGGSPVAYRVRGERSGPSRCLDWPAAKNDGCGSCERFGVDGRVLVVCDKVGGRSILDTGQPEPGTCLP
jgi:hypothetical protein